MRILTFALCAGALLAGSQLRAQHPYGLPAPLVAPQSGSYLLTARQAAEPAAPAPLADIPPATELSAEDASLHEPTDYFGCDDCCGPCWYGSVGALILTRDDVNPIELSIDQSIPGVAFVDLITTESASPDDWKGGVEATVGYNVWCNWWLAGTWWYVDPVSAEALAVDAGGNIDTPLSFAGLDFVGTTVDNLFNGAQAHVLRRSSEFDNLEINLVNMSMDCGACSPLRTSYSAGVRYFRFSDDFLFGSADTSTQFGVDPANEAFYEIQIDNHLWGAQVGGRVEYTNCNWGAYLAPSVGIYNNHVKNQSRIFRGNGEIAQRFDGRDASVATTDDRFSVLAQIDVGARYQATCHLSGYVGYRVVAASGVATTTAQIPMLGADIEGMADTNASEWLLLHGAFAGVEFSY